MTTYDPAWDMPKTNWQQQGSFEQGELALVDHPSDAPLVCIPPINRHWLPYILGCLDQLTNPSTWIVSSDAAMNAILDKAIELKQIVGSAGECVLCPEMRLHDCVLQFSCDGGATWTDVTGWAANFASCVQSSVTFPPAPEIRLTGGGTLQQSIDGGSTFTDVTGWTDNFCTTALACSIAPIPPNPGATPHDQHACNLAGYLATKVIQETMVQAHAVIAASGDQLTFATDVMQEIGFAFPLTYAVTLAFHDFFNALVGESLTDINTAATDPALWSQVTCAIYEAIVGVGYVDATNFAAVATNLAIISYPFAWVAPALHNYWNELGLNNIRAQQNVGALADEDCSGCTSTWCYWFGVGGDETGFAAWTPFGTAPAVYVSGQGWKSQPAAGGQQFGEVLITPGSGSFQCVSVEINYTTVHADAGGARNFQAFDPGAHNFALSSAAGTFTTLVPVNLSPSTIAIYVDTNTNNPTDFNYIHWIKIRGLGTPPTGWSPANCI